ncbi:hypothetical protein PCANC_00469 [Puccinia coronata f. sp. avenae]|uniref:Uncharacterized protein n=1 Tax=Puccinia coronata f. sp. avenae TaxID=200324 RepID=A0A2N5W7Z5_9BASI|nr:hypothetical protein PCANC_00469 [Puccinia coronata f. sp. avenae]
MSVAGGLGVLRRVPRLRVLVRLDLYMGYALRHPLYIYPAANSAVFPLRQPLILGSASIWPATQSFAGMGGSTPSYNGHHLTSLAALLCQTWGVLPKVLPWRPLPLSHAKGSISSHE